MTTLTPAIETDRLHIPLSAIGPNPYQTRLSEDPAHIAGLAEDILANGLLQVPLARPHGILNMYELAFGHSRLAAYKLLVEQGHAEYGHLPMDVRALTDRQMSDLAAAENARRKNLTAIETATALQTRITAFKLSQAEAGAPFGLSQSAVSNLLRLLALPESMREMVHTGELPERHARQLATLAKAAPKEVEKIAQKVAKAKPAERDETFADQVGLFLQDQGRDLRNAPFDVSWPLVPIPVQHPTGDQPEYLQACLGCPHYYKYDWNMNCCLPACYDLKEAAALDERLQAAAKKTGLPIADEDLKTFPVLSDSRQWERGHRLGELVKAGKAERGLGLVLVAGDKVSQYTEGVTGSAWIQVHTTAPTAVNNWFAAKDHKNGSNGTGKAVIVPPPPPDPSKPETPAQRAKREAAEAAAKEAERQAQEERRRERGAALRNEADVVWLIKNFVDIAAPQLTISSHILLYAVHRWIGRGRGKERAAMYDGLREWYDDMESESEQAGHGKAADELRRRLLVAAEVFEHCLGDFGNERRAFGHVVDELVDLANVVDMDEPGLGAKLPQGWNKPPVHRTEGNCWTCGTFASQRGKLTKDEQAAGWHAAYQGETATGVTCPDCRKPALGSAAKPAAAKKGGRK